MHIAKYLLLIFSFFIVGCDGSKQNNTIAKMKKPYCLGHLKSSELVYKDRPLYYIMSIINHEVLLELFIPDSSATATQKYKRAGVLGRALRKSANAPEDTPPRNTFIFDSMDVKLTLIEVDEDFPDKKIKLGGKYYKYKLIHFKKVQGKLNDTVLDEKVTQDLVGLIEYVWQAAMSRAGNNIAFCADPGQAKPENPAMLIKPDKDCNSPAKDWIGFCSESGEWHTWWLKDNWYKNQGWWNDSNTSSWIANTPPFEPAALN